MSSELRNWLLEHEDWLINRVILYAKRQGYAEYTSTLVEAWRVSIRELTATLVRALEVRDEVVDFRPDEAFDHDPISTFAILEADRHRERGIELKMFLGLFKYYRQAYLDLVEEAGFEAEQRDDCWFFVTRVFDRLEIAYCHAWANLGDENKLHELQDSNRRMTNEKNRFLTVAESLGAPVVLFDNERKPTYLNRAAAEFFGLPEGPGTFYYSQPQINLDVPEWLVDLLCQYDGSQQNWRSEHSCETANGVRVFSVRLQPMLDISGKFEGTVVVMYEISALRQAERELAAKAQELERLSNTDDLTGLLNRRGLITVAEKFLQMAERSGKEMSVVYGDVDKLKWVNDRYGHVVGDAALTAVAKALQSSCRAADVIARVGGDEFVVLLPESDELHHDEWKQRLCLRLTRELATVEGKPELSLSTGWVSYDPAEHQSFDQLLVEADVRMYQAKRSEGSGS